MPTPVTDDDSEPYFIVSPGLISPPGEKEGDQMPSITFSLSYASVESDLFTKVTSQLPYDAISFPGREILK